jgi:hypothetical protein
MSAAAFPDSTVIGPVIITRDHISALAGAQAALEVLAERVSEKTRADMLRDAAGVKALASLLIDAIARQQVRAP